MGPRVGVRRKGMPTKQTTEIIIKAKNHYVVAVKKNQKTLFNQIINNLNSTGAIDVNIEEEKTSGILNTRIIEVFDNLGCINQNYWRGIKRIIKVTRIKKKKGNESVEEALYISYLELDGKLFAKIIREHWSIENRLHWVLDTVLEEDKSKIRTGNAPQNMTIIRKIVMNIYRYYQIDSIKFAQRMFSNKIKNLLAFLTMKI